MQCSVVTCDEQAVVSAVAVPIGAEHIRVDVAYCVQHWPEYQEKFKSFGSIDLVDIHSAHPAHLYRTRDGFYDDMKITPNGPCQVCGLEEEDPVAAHIVKKSWMNDQIAEIDARWQNATPGPWKAVEQTHGEWVGIQDDFSALGSMVKPADADAVAHARGDIAYLIDAYRHMVESWQTAENAIQENAELHGVILKMRLMAESLECEGVEKSDVHRRHCSGCSRAGVILSILGDR